VLSPGDSTPPPPRVRLLLPAGRVELRSGRLPAGGGDDAAGSRRRPAEARRPAQHAGRSLLQGRVRAASYFQTVTAPQSYFYTYGCGVCMCVSVSVFVFGCVCVCVCVCRCFQQAVDLFSLALQCDPSAGPYYESRSKAFRKVLDLEGARRDLICTLILDPTSEEVGALYINRFLNMGIPTPTRGRQSFTGGSLGLFHFKGKLKCSLLISLHSINFFEENKIIL